MIRRALRLAAALAVAAAVATPAPAAAQAAPSARLALASQTAWVRDSGLFTVRLDVDAVRSPQRIDLEIVVHRAVRSRSQFAGTLDGRLLGSTVHRDRVPLRSLRFDSGGALPVQVALPTLRTGVYPVTIDLLDTETDDSLASLVTHLVRVPNDDVEVPLSVAWVQRYGTNPALQPDGTVSLDDDALDGLRAVAGQLRGNVPLTVTPTPETIAALATLDDGRTTTALAELLSRHQVVSAPFVDLDVSALVAADRDDDVARQRTEGDRVLDEVLGITGDNRTWASGGVVTTEAVDVLESLGVRRVVLDEDALVPLDADATRGLTLTRPFTVAGRGSTELAAFAVDPGIAAHFNGRDEVLAAHHLLADLAVLQLDSPGLARGVIVRPPRDAAPSEVFVSTVLTNLASSPLLQPVTLDQLFATVEPLTDDDDEPVVREMADLDPPALGFNPNAIDRARSEMLAFQSLLVDRTTTELPLLDRLLLVAESRDLQPERRRAYIDAATAQIAGTTGKVRVLGDRTYRLTAREGTIPLTLVNDNPFDVRVEVELASDKLTFTGSTTEGSSERREVLLGANRTTTEAIPVKARTSGTFSMRVTVRSPDGRLQIGVTRFTITSTVASGIGVLLSVGAALFLLLWWAKHWRTVRRSRRLVPAG